MQPHIFHVRNDLKTFPCDSYLRWMEFLSSDFQIKIEREHWDDEKDKLHENQMDFERTVKVYEDAVQRVNIRI